MRCSSFFMQSSFSGGPFSRPGFGSSSSGGFSGGNTFSSQGGGVLSSGFGFGAASGPGKKRINQERASCGEQRSSVSFIYTSIA